MFRVVEPHHYVPFSSLFIANRSVSVLMGHRNTALAAVATLALVATACGSADSADNTSTTTTVPPTTTSTISEEHLAAIQYEEDVETIKTLLRRYSDSWFCGIQAAYVYLEEHNYPAEECTAEDFATSFNVTEGFQEEIVVDESTIERDDGWPIPGGAASGTVPEGRIYIFTVTVTDRDPGFNPVEQVGDVHAIVLDEGTTYFFFACGKG